jgi:hypothetical protein
MVQNKMDHNEKPEIFAVADLVHLNKKQRLALLGQESWLNRRRFLKTLLGTVVVAGTASLPRTVFGAAPQAPTVYISTTIGTTPMLTISWTTVTDATGYTLFWAPYPSADPISSLDMGNETSVTAPLWYGAAFYVAVQAYNNSGKSTYSNIEQFEVQKTELKYPTIVSIDTKPSENELARIYFSQKMDRDSVSNALLITMPEVPADLVLYILWVGDGFIRENMDGAQDCVSLYSVETLSDLAFDLTIAATAMDVAGNPLDGNADGISGDAWSHTYTPTPPCSCESYTACSCESYTTCTCQSYTCSCQYYGCMCEVQCGCQLYRI